MRIQFHVRLAHKIMAIAVLGIAGLLVFGAIYPFVSSAMLLPVIGLLLTIPIYVLVALLFAVYVPELFPTPVRLRASGICNTLGRGATIATPFAVVWLFANHGVTGVLLFMIALLVVQIIAVAGWGIETRGRALEDVAAGAARADLSLATDASSRR